MSIQTAVQLLGGVGIFLFAIKLLSESLQALADNKLRSLIATLTRTPILGVIVGTVATMFLQSSSATTVMTISFVDAGLMTLKQAVGVIMGANIGTTITGQIVAFNLKDFAYVFIIIGVILNLATKSKSKKDLGIGIFAFGLLFVGMQTMENAMYFLRDRSDFFLMFADNHFLGLLAGAGLTLLVQSSSATMGITIALSIQGLMPLPAALSIILGVNVGTTITAMLAAIGTSRAAKQTSAAHVLFNLIAVIIFYPLIPFCIPFIESTASTIPHQIANAHTLINIINTLIFLPFVNPFTKLIRALISDKNLSENKVEDVQSSNLDPQLIENSPIEAVAALKHECYHMVEITLKQLNALEEILFNNNTNEIEFIKSSEKELNFIYDDISNYASLLTQASLPNKLSKQIYSILSFANDLERIGDKTTQLIVFYNERISSNQEFPSTLQGNFQAIFNDAREVYKLSYFLLSQAQNDKEFSKKDIKSIKKKISKSTKNIKFKSYNALLLPEIRDKAFNTKLEHAFTESIRIMERIANRASAWVHTIKE